MKIVRVRCEWRTDHEIEVPDDFDPVDDIYSWPEEYAAQIRPDMPELMDWNIR